MTCEKLRPILNAYLDGELPEVEASEVTKHLNVCASCRGEVDELKNIGMRAQNLRFEAPPILAEHIALRLAMNRSPSRLRRHLSIAAAAAVLAIAAGAWFWIAAARHAAAASLTDSAIASLSATRTIHLVQRVGQHTQLDLWYGEPHVEDGKVCWVVAVPNENEPQSVPFYAEPVSECDGITLRIDMHPPDSAVIEKENGVIRVADRSSSWTVLIDSRSGLPTERTRGEEVLKLEFNKPLPAGLTYFPSARPHLQFR